MEKMEIQPYFCVNSTAELYLAVLLKFCCIYNNFCEVLMVLLLQGLWQGADRPKIVTSTSGLWPRLAMKWSVNRAALGVMRQCMEVLELSVLCCVGVLPFLVLASVTMKWVCEPCCTGSDEAVYGNVRIECLV